LGVQMMVASRPPPLLDAELPLPELVDPELSSPEPESIPLLDPELLAVVASPPLRAPELLPDPRDDENAASRAPASLSAVVAIEPPHPSTTAPNAVSVSATRRLRAPTLPILPRLGGAVTRVARVLWRSSKKASCEGAGRQLAHAPLRHRREQQS
jgi:hypothetical protein